MEFAAEILATGKTTTGIEVDPDVVTALGGGKRPKVTVSFRGHTYRTSVAAMGGRFLVSVSGEVRERTGVVAGDRVEVELTLDTEERTVDVPPELAAALAARPAAEARFATLSYSARRRLVEPIVAAKAAETRQRRIDRAVASLAEDGV